MQTLSCEQQRHLFTLSSWRQHRTLREINKKLLLYLSHKGYYYRKWTKQPKFNILSVCLSYCANSLGKVMNITVLLTSYK